MKVPLDIQKIRKKRQRNARLKQILALALIALGILTALYVNDIFVRRNLSDKLGGIVDSVGGEGFPTNLPSGTIRNLGGIGKTLIVLKDSNLYMYNNKGKQIENIQQMTDRTLIDTNSEKVLYYDVGGREAAVHSGTAEVYKIKLDNNIVHADIGNSGEVAVVTSPPNFVAAVEVFSRSKPEAIYTRTFSDKIISSVAVSPKGKQIALASFSTDGGVLDFSLLLYPLDKEAEPVVIPVGNRLILDINFYMEDTIIVLTDKDCLVFDVHKASLIGSHTFSENTGLVEFRRKNNYILALSKDQDTKEYILNIINPQGTSLSNIRFEKKPLDFDFNDQYIYLLKWDKLEEYNYAMGLVNKYAVNNVERIYLLKDDVYLIKKNEIDLLKKTEGDK